MGEPYENEGVDDHFVADHRDEGVATASREVVVLIRDQAHRARVTNALETGGYSTVLPEQILVWAAARRPQVLLVTDDTNRTAALRAAVAAVAPEVACVVLVTEPSLARYRTLLSTCLAVLPEDVVDEDLLAAMAAVSRYLACLPARAVSALTGGTGVRPKLTPSEIGWLRDLADGGKVAALARTAGYSQREMYRLLADLYARLGASTRTEALLAADRLGLLVGEEPRPPALAQPAAAPRRLPVAPR